MRVVIPEKNEKNNLDIVEYYFNGFTHSDYIYMLRILSEKKAELIREDCGYLNPEGQVDDDEGWPLYYSKCNISRHEKLLP